MRLIGLSQSTYVNNMLKMFNMQNSKKDFLHMLHDISLCKNECSLTHNEQNHMSKIQYTLTIEFIMYVM